MLIRKEQFYGKTSSKYSICTWIRNMDGIQSVAVMHLQGLRASTGLPPTKTTQLNPVGSPQRPENMYIYTCVPCISVRDARNPDTVRHWHSRHVWISWSPLVFHSFSIPFRSLQFPWISSWTLVLVRARFSKHIGSTWNFPAPLFQTSHPYYRDALWLSVSARNSVASWSS